MKFVDPIGEALGDVARMSRRAVVDDELELVALETRPPLRAPGDVFAVGRVARLAVPRLVVARQAARLAVAERELPDVLVRRRRLDGVVVEP